jgi:hypothetical protein
MLVCALVWPGAAFGVQQLAYSNGGSLYLRAADGSTKARVVHAYPDINSIVYSPGGEKIALSGGSYDGVGTDRLQVYDVSKNRLATVYAGTRYYHSPYFQTWSPNGRYLIYKRSDTSRGLLYDCSRRSTRALPSGDEFLWSPGGAKIAVVRGGGVWVMPAPYGTLVRIADMTEYLTGGGFHIEWSPDSSTLYAGYYDETAGNQVWAISVATHAVNYVGDFPWGWDNTMSRVGGWAAVNSPTPPARITNGSTTVTVGPNRDNAAVLDISSDGSWVSLIDWWGGKGQWYVWTCQRGRSPRRIGTGLWSALQPTRLATLSTPSLPSRFKHGTVQTARGTEYLATAAYPGRGTVKLAIQKWSGGAWHAWTTPTASLSGSGTRRSYAKTLKLSRGMWRVRAVRPYSLACDTVLSGWRTVKVW